MRGDEPENAPMTQQYREAPSAQNSTPACSMCGGRLGTGVVGFDLHHGPNRERRYWCQTCALKEDDKRFVKGQG